jgi:hypothetical protein
VANLKNFLDGSCAMLSANLALRLPAILRNWGTSFSLNPGASRTVICGLLCFFLTRLRVRGSWFEVAFMVDLPL